MIEGIHPMLRTLVRTLALVLATVGLLLPIGSVSTASAAPDNFTPKTGATFNSPLGGSSERREIFRKVMRSINSSPKGSNINIFTWNFLTSEGKDALLRAQKRGVRVRLLMDDLNVKSVDNPPFRALRAGLQRGNKKVPAKRQSFARVCDKTCRGGGGAAHSKFYMFSRSGKARNVVIQGSANFTLASTNNQWNDIYTHVGNQKVYDWAGRIFQQAVRDKRAKKPYADRNFGNFRLMMFPNTGKNVPDPVMQTLNRVKCKGATNTASNRTRIRIFPDVMRNPRGNALARKVKSLWNNGCDIRIGYTVMGIDTGKILRSGGGRGPVPMRHMVQDTNGDGQFDNYFHMKSMSIVGNYGGDRSGYALLNGSANWSGLAKVSDENLGLYRSKATTQRYQEHMNYWYDRFSGRARLVFGAGRDAVYEDGTQVSPGGAVDPFARVATD
ncbi:conserved exported hypothetical protein [Nocardioides sp. AX2bis]|nr:conserved exported hypothetical protein [Nocardioides sp. AX2bis]